VCVCVCVCVRTHECKREGAQERAVAISTKTIAATMNLNYQTLLA